MCMIYLGLLDNIVGVVDSKIKKAKVKLETN